MRFNLNASFTPGTPENRSIAERDTLNSAVNMLFAENALKGVGLGALPLALRERFPDFPIDYQPAHIVLLDVAAETGILGALWFMIALGGPWLALWLNRRRLAFSPALVGVTGVLMATTLVSFFDYYTWLLAPGRLWQWLVWGLWAALYQSSLDKHLSTRPLEGQVDKY
jgi:O-antigen ligase